MKEEFLKSIEGLDVQWWGKDKLQGDITKGGVTFHFEIMESFIRKELRISVYIDTTIENFIKISDNKYKQKTK